jgi:hypothetical protein
MGLNRFNNDSNCIICTAVIFLAIFVVGLIFFNSNCNSKVSSPCQNIEVSCNLNNFSVYNKTQNVQNITFYYLNLICNYANNASCIIYDGQFYNYDILIDYFNYYYNNSDIYTIYQLNSSNCSFDIPNQDANIVLIGMCIMIITTILFLMTCCYYYKPRVHHYINQQIQRNQYVHISNNVDIEKPPVYSP